MKNCERTKAPPISCPQSLPVQDTSGSANRACRAPKSREEVRRKHDEEKLRSPEQERCESLAQISSPARSHVSAASSRRDVVAGDTEGRCRSLKKCGVAVVPLAKPLGFQDSHTESSTSLALLSTPQSPLFCRRSGGCSFKNPMQKPLPSTSQLLLHHQSPPRQPHQDEEVQKRQDCQAYADAQGKGVEVKSPRWRYKPFQDRADF